MFFVLLLMRVEYLVLVSPFPFLSFLPHLVPQSYFCGDLFLTPRSPMLPYLRGRGPISPMFACLWAGRLQSKDQQGQHESLISTASSRIGQPLRNKDQQGQHSLATAYSCPSAELTVCGWSVTCGTWTTRDKF
jgi:hypothetical protein